MHTYAAAGVDIAAAEENVRRIRGHVRSTHGPEVLGDFGAFAGLFHLQGLRDPVLVASTDGVGTKLLLGLELGRFDGLGRDLVNLSVNDVLTTGARPLFFLDYVGVHAIDHAVMEALVGGMAAACRENGCALLGGETAQLPELYAPDHFDLAGTVIGVVERSEIIDGSTVEPGNRVWGLPSNGLHTNGYTLARRIVAEAGLELQRAPELKHVPELERVPDQRLGQTANAAALGPSLGEQSPGGKSPGGKSPGGKSPGGKSLGRESLGGQSPGGQSPGGQSLGGQSARGQSLGGQSLGGRSPGGQSPGGQSPGGQSPGGQSAGGQSVGRQSVGGHSPGGHSLGDALLAPHPSYLAAMYPLRHSVKAIAHITGGGIPGTLPRVLPEHVSAELDWGSWPVPPIFVLLQELGHVGDQEMLRVFNMGLGLIFVTAPSCDPRPDCPTAMEVGRIVQRGEQRVVIRPR